MVHFTLLISSVISFIKNNKKLWLRLAFSILIIFAILRYNFGNDYLNYYKTYNKIQGGDFVLTNEPIFTILAKLLPNFYLLIAVTSIFTIVPIYFLIKNYVVDKYKGFAVLIYCINPYLFLMSLSTIRQMLALSFFIIAIHFSKEHKYIPYLIFIVLAINCHISAIILLPFYFIANDKKVNRIQVFAVVSALIILLIENSLFERLLQYGLNFFDNINYNFYSTMGGNTLRATLLSSIWFIYIVININRLSGNTLMFAKLNLIGYIFDILAYRVSMLDRITTYFEIFSIVSIPMIMHQNNTSLNCKSQIFYVVNKYVLPILIFAIYILRYYSFFTNPLWESFREYHTILSIL